jgi:hypothetical protein
MKRFLSLFALATLIMAFISCNKEKTVGDMKPSYVGEASLLEDYSDTEEDKKQSSPDSIVLPFEKDKEV